MKETKAPSRWPDNVVYLSQSCLAPDFPQELRHLVVGPVSAPSSGYTSRRVPVAIKTIDDPLHPAYGQRGNAFRIRAPYLRMGVCRARF